MGKQHRRQLEKQVQFQLRLLMLLFLDKDLVGRVLHEKIVPQEISGQYLTYKWPGLG